MAVFEFLRVSLVARKQGDLFAKKFNSDDHDLKREFLDDIFSRDRWDFEHSAKTFTLVAEHRFENIIVFRFGKQKLELGHEGPDQGFSPVFNENWELAWAVFDLDSESQIFVVQNKIGSPRNIVKSLLNRIETETLESPYEFEVEYISDKSEFWSAAEEYKGKITRIEFSFLPPNMLELTEKIRDIVVSAKTQLGSEKTVIAHTNSEGGLHPNRSDDYTNAALDVVADGAGSTKMKAGRKTIFSSSKNRKTADIGNDELPEDNTDKGALEELARSLKKVQDDS